MLKNGGEPLVNRVKGKLKTRMVKLECFALVALRLEGRDVRLILGIECHCCWVDLNASY